MGSLPRPRGWRLFAAIVPIAAALLLLGSRQSRAVANCDPSTGDAGLQHLSVRVVPSSGATDLALCGVQEPDRPEPAAPVPDVTQTNLATALAVALAANPSDAGISGSAADALPLSLRLALPSVLTSNTALIWPAFGPITQPFGVPELGVGAPHTGIDIGQQAGTPVRAALAGRVVFAGGDPCCGLGYWIEIDHGNRLATVYGHFMRPPLLLVGDYVKQGQTICFAGTTGFSTGPHLHFEVRLDGRPIDPLRALPSR
jgi:murein DD-endopeptidase MepM/ murein hydrolase activator NlpD